MPENGLSKLPSQAKELVKSHKIGMSSLATRMKAKQQKAAADPEKALEVKTNRILLLLDLSGSMDSHCDGKAKIEHLKDALNGYADAMNPQDTSTAALSFPFEERFLLPATSDIATLKMYAWSIATIGDTPLGAAMDRGLHEFSMTRAIIVSDGQQTDGEKCFDIAKEYAEAAIPCDCVHIGRSEQGEATLTKIAEITGGKYIKFDNVANFARSMKFLTPAFRELLMSSDAAQILGAKEVK